MSERIAISHDDQEKLSAQGCYIERSSATEEQIAEACKTDLKGLKAKLATYWVSTELLASLKAEVQPGVQPVAEPVTVWAKSDRAWSADSWNTGWDAAKKAKEGDDLTGPLPIAPTTAFNVMRLVQLWYFPKDYGALWWEKPNIFHKGVQMFYVVPGKIGEAIRTKANTAYQKKFDRDAAYKDFMLDLTKQMNSELSEWYKQNKLSQKVNIDTARQSLVDIQTAFRGGKSAEAFAHFDTLTEKMGMRVNGMWHTPAADLWALRAEQDGKTGTTEARVQKTKDIKTARDGQLQWRKDDLKVKKDAVTTIFAQEAIGHNSLDTRFQAEGVKGAEIWEEIKRLELEKRTLENHTWALTNEPQNIRDAIGGRDFRAIETSRNTIWYAHATTADVFLPAWSELATKQGNISLAKTEIENYDRPKWLIKQAETQLESSRTNLTVLQTEETKINGQLADTRTADTAKPALEARLKQLVWDKAIAPATVWLIEQARTEYETKKTTLDTVQSDAHDKRIALSILENEKRWLITQSEQNKVAFDWFTGRNTRITQLSEKIRAYTALKPLVEARNVSARKLSLTEKSIAKSAESIAKREQKAVEAHDKASPIHEALDKLQDPTISRSKALEMNEKLNELLAKKNPEALRIQALLQWTLTQRNQAIRELQIILDTNAKWVEFFKSSLENIEWKIKSLHTEASRIMTEFDRQAGTGDAEALRKKATLEIGKINTEIERLNNDARAKYWAATTLLTPVQVDSLHKASPLAGFFWALNSWVQVAEKVGSSHAWGKAMRWVYGTLTLVGLGQIGVTTANAGLRQWAIDAADMAIGFVPVVWGAYDILVGLWQAAKGSELTSDRKVERLDALKRIWFGMLWLVPIAGQAVKAWVKWEKIVEVARKVAVVERAAEVTGKVMVLNEAKNLWVALYDATGSIASERWGVQKTAESLYLGRQLPINANK